MKYISLRFFIALTTFLISIAATCGWIFFYYRHEVPSTESVEAPFIRSNIPSAPEGKITHPEETASSKEIENWSKEDIKKFSLALGLVPITKIAQRKEFELRLWINLGMPGDEKLLIVRSREIGNHAYFYHLRKIVTELIKFQKEVLASPKSGWNTLLPEISNQLATPGRLVRDPQFELARHEGVIWLEVIEKGEYQFVFYGHHTSFDSGIRLINLCEYLSGQFGINIDCRGEHTILEPIG